MHRERMYTHLLVALLVAGMLLSGCGPSATPTPPPATVISPDAAEPVVQPPPSNPTTAPTATQVAPPVAKVAEPTPYLPPMPPGFTDGKEPQEPPVVYPDANDVEYGGTGKGYDVTILHSNDVQGEIDPCG